MDANDDARMGMPMCPRCNSYILRDTCDRCGHDPWTRAARTAAWVGQLDPRYNDRGEAFSGSSYEGVWRGLSSGYGGGGGGDFRKFGRSFDPYHRRPHDY